MEQLCQTDILFTICSFLPNSFILKLCTINKNIHKKTFLREEFWTFLIREQQKHANALLTPEDSLFTNPHCNKIVCYECNSKTPPHVAKKLFHQLSRSLRFDEQFQLEGIDFPSPDECCNTGKSMNIARLQWPITVEFGVSSAKKKIINFELEVNFSDCGSPSPGFTLLGVIDAAIFSSFDFSAYGYLGNYSDKLLNIGYADNGYISTMRKGEFHSQFEAGQLVGLRLKLNTETNENSCRFFVDNKACGELQQFKLPKGKSNLYPAINFSNNAKCKLLRYA